MLEFLYRHRWRILLLVTVWLIFESAISWFAFCDPTNHQHDNYKADDDYCSALKGPLVSLTRAFFVGFGHFVKDEHDAIIALGTLIIALFTFTLWRSTHRLWLAGEEQIKVGYRSARAAWDAATAAENQVRLAERTAQRQLRAYVTVMNGRVEIDSATQTFIIFVELKNSGQSPAYQCAVDLNIELFDLSIPIDLREPLPETNRQLRTLIGPNNVYTVSGECRVEGAQAQAIVNRTWTIYVWGRADYQDIFGRQRWTTFRSFVRHVAGHGFVLQPARNGNDADQT